MIGSDTMSINGWENHRSFPIISFFPKIIKFLGYNPFDTEFKTLKDKLIFYRRLSGLSHRKFAALLNIDPGTVSDWEKELHKPTKRMKDKLNKFFNSY